MWESKHEYNAQAGRKQLRWFWRISRCNIRSHRRRSNDPVAQDLKSIRTHYQTAPPLKLGRAMEDSVALQHVVVF